MTVNGLIDAVLAGANKVYQPTSYYDLDPDVGGPSFGGYSFYASLYNRYRVTHFDYEIEWSNLEADSVMVSALAIPASSTPSELFSAYNPEVAKENNFSRAFLLGPKGGSQATRTMRGSVSCEAVWGTPEVLTDAGWAAGVGTSPSINTFLMLSAWRINGTALALGAQFVLTITSVGYWDQKSNPTS